MAALLVACTLLYGVAIGLLLTRHDPHAPALAFSWPTRISTPAPVGATPAARVPGGPTPLPAETAPLPVGLSIPAIDVEESTVLPLGRTPDGSMEVPEDFARIGWFTGGSVPGTAGPAIIAGHVDSFRGPAVFFRLRELKPGDLITVRLADKTSVQYVVDGVEKYSKEDFPTQTVFGPVPGEALRLITCGGSFDRLARSYRDNIVVYATRRLGTN